MINENYNTIKDLLKDPTSDIYNSLKKFKADGGEILGEGSFAIVLAKPEWKFVIKLFMRDDSYLRFVRFSIQNPRSSYPIFYDIPRKVSTSFKHSVLPTTIDNVYLVKTERLYPISHKEYNDIEFYLAYKIDDYKMKLARTVVDNLNRIVKEYPNIDNFQKDFYFAVRNVKGPKKSDLKQNNIMKRKNGIFVLVDPFYNFDSAMIFENNLR